ncbi:MAG: (2Fe-2S)-binding protein [Pseudonocardiaceae bacterium]
MYSRHPLATSVVAVDDAVDWMTFRLLDRLRDGGTTCEQALSDPPFFTRWRARVANQLGQHHTAVPERTTAGYVLQWYLGIPATLGAMLFHSARRVPSLQPEQLAFRLDPGWVQDVALRPSRFWCLPADPDAGHPDAIPVADETALGAELRREVVSHATRFLQVYGPLVRFGRRALWAAVTDVLDTSLLLAGRAFGSARAGAADARLVLAHRIEPFTSASTTCSIIDERGRTHWTRRRGSCCFYYALPGVESPCATCPRTDDAGRARILGTLDQP